MKSMPLLAAALLATGAHARERLLTTSPHGHQIHHRQVFSPDGRYIYYDSRNDETQLAASSFIGRVEIATGREEILYRVPDASSYGPGVGAVTCNPVTGRLAFIHGLDKASAAEPYAAHRRSGASLTNGGELIRLDARDVTPPFTPGALSGGTHAHHWSPDGSRLSFTYNDALIPIRPAPADLRTVGIMIAGPPGDGRGMPRRMWIFQENASPRWSCRSPPHRGPAPMTSRAPSMKAGSTRGDSPSRALSAVRTAWT